MEQSGLGNEVELRVKKQEIIITRVKKTREGWEEAFQEMSKQGDDRLLDDDELTNQSSWDEYEWSW